MHPNTENEKLAEDLCKMSFDKGNRIQLQLWPDQKKTIVTGAYNKIRIETGVIHNRIKWFNNISEPFYDYLVEHYHEKYKKTRN